MTQPDPLISFRNVEKTYDGRVNVVEQLNLDIVSGEFLTLLGPSGSGKTTTLMMLAGFEAPTGGDILLTGRSLATVPAHKRSMGMVFQNYALFPHMTVGENLAYPLRRRKVAKPEIARALARAVEMVELTGLEERYPGQLSGGQQQRVALARALIFQPDVVLMDEPLGALDKNLREQMQLELKHLHAQLGTTFVYVTHDQSEALTMSNRVAVFRDGIVQQLDDPEALYERPATSFVADFIGENNALSGQVIGKDGAYSRVRLDIGHEISALAVNAADDGRTSVSVRPERVRLASEGDGAVNLIPAHVVETIYFGDHVRLHVHVGGQPLMLKLPLGEASGLGPDDQVRLTGEPAHFRALDPPPA
ncbi:MAG: ABC transporter ATP-binding protein [Alphaproteobacteria bacterium]|jgi:putative spermidine/putrescine transport system ATP-binding protein|nr:ABC transporter ATP-binding protein [Alphaproteobacteria bacterium]